MLTGPQIALYVDEGLITISPFKLDQVGSNSYDLRLANRLLTYVDNVLDMKADNKTQVMHIPDEGLVLWPGQLYLGSTEEVAGSRSFVPCVSGRSSTGRLGISVHVTAGFGDVGFIGRWTLELVVVKPVRVYAGARVCQIYFEDVRGPILQYSDRPGSKYSREPTGPEASRMHLDYELKGG